MKLALLVVALGIMTGCVGDPVSTASTNNGKIQVDLLFENDGCKVYRFMDGMRYHYYASCRQGTAVTQSEKSEGKSSSYPEEITTGTVTGTR